MNAIVVLIIVARGETVDATTPSAVKAARDLLGPNLEAEVRALDMLPSDDDAVEMAADVHASAIFELSWDHAEHRRARLHFRLRPETPWNDRVLEFNADDDPAERGRTLGFAIASMVPAGPDAHSSPSSSPSKPAIDARGESELPLSPHKALPPPSGSIEVVGAGSIGVQGNASAWGGAANLRWHWTDTLSTRWGASVRAGTVDVAQARSLLVHASAGLVWAPIPSTALRPFQLAGRASVLVMREGLSHYSADDPSAVTRERWLPGAEAGIETFWNFGSHTGFVTAIATEVAFGRTDVTLHGERVASLPPLRVVLQAGIRAGF